MSALVGRCVRLGHDAARRLDRDAVETGREDFLNGHGDAAS